MTDTIPPPTVNLVRELGIRFDHDPYTALIEPALDRLVAQFPHNKDACDVLLKVTTINALYSTNIYAVVAVAEHIVKQDIDSAIAAGSPDAVEQVARIQFKGQNKVHFYYSFASKYCSWHNQNAYPIFDRRVRNTLSKYKKQDKFDDFSTDELWCSSGYERFREIVSRFRTHYELNELNFKEIDKFLYWFDLIGDYDTVPLSTQETVT
jgi:hypothetical protein